MYCTGPLPHSSSAEKKTNRKCYLHTQNQSTSYLPIIVECCWTAASSSLSKIVHSPMVSKRWQKSQKKQDLGSQPPPFLQGTPSRSSQDQPALWWRSRGYNQPPVPPQLPFDLYTLTWPLITLSLWMRASVFCWACPALLPFQVLERC